MNNKIPPCTDCFAYRRNRCIVLIEMVCKTKRCTFYKTRRQFTDDLKKYPLTKDMERKIKYLMGSENECEKSLH